MEQLSSKEVYYIIVHYIDTRKLLKKLGLDVRANNSMFCPFHDNENTPAAHLYKEEDGSYRIYCYSEDRLFSNVDLYKTYLPDINLNDLAQLLFNNLSEVEKERLADNVNKVYELPELPYSSYLEKFKIGEIDYQHLLHGINLSVPQDDTIRLLNLIYNYGDKDVPINMQNKYLYFMKNYESNYRFISASKLIVNFSSALPSYFLDYLGTAGDCIALPNMVGETVYSLTFRNLQGDKQFIKMGSGVPLLYNLGGLPKDFHYGIPIMLVEGNMDCDSAKQIYPYTLATLTNALSLNQIQILSGLTNKIIVAYDNDESGNKGYWGVYNSLTKLGFKVVKFRHSQSLKDFGDLIDLQMKDREEYLYMVEMYNIQLKTLLSNF